MFQEEFQKDDIKGSQSAKNEQDDPEADRNASYRNTHPLKAS